MILQRNLHSSTIVGADSKDHKMKIHWLIKANAETRNSYLQSVMSEHDYFQRMQFPLKSAILQM